MYIKSHKGEYCVELVDYAPTINKDSFIVIDKFIKDIYYPNLDNAFVVETDEDSKTLEASRYLIDFLLERGFKKNDTIYAIGGGVIQDLVSFTCSIVYRGVNWEFVPTTLLAQCDSCIGSKTSINYNGYKNILGGFHPPKNIKIWNGFLETLPIEEIKSGIGEMLHYFLLNHKLEISERMVNDSDLIANINVYLTESLTIKKEMIEKDEFDKGERNLFNYGHTFGHALETLTNYKINHGQAVTFGMEIANKLSLKKNMISQEKYNKLAIILEKNIPNYKIKDVDVYIEALKKDKKNISDKLTCILLIETSGTKIEITYNEVGEILQ